MEQDDEEEGPFSILVYPEDPTIDTSPALMFFGASEEIEDHLGTLDIDRNSNIKENPSVQYVSHHIIQHVLGAAL